MVGFEWRRREDEGKWVKEDPWEREREREREIKRGWVENIWNKEMRDQKWEVKEVGNWKNKWEVRKFLSGTRDAALILVKEIAVISFKPIMATFSFIAMTLNLHNKSWNFQIFVKILKDFNFTYSNGFKTAVIGS